MMLKFAIILTSLVIICHGMESDNTEIDRPVDSVANSLLSAFLEDLKSVEKETEKLMLRVVADESTVEVNKKSFSTNKRRVLTNNQGTVEGKESSSTVAVVPTMTIIAGKGIKHMNINNNGVALYNPLNEIKRKDELDELHSIIAPAFPVVDSKRNLYVSVYSKHYIKKISLHNGMITKYSLDDESTKEGDYKVIPNRGALGLAVDPNDNIYIADRGSCVIRHLSVSNQVSSIYAGNSNECGYAGDERVANDIHVAFNEPSDLALDHNGNLFIADTNNQVIRKVDTSTNIVTTFFGKKTDGGGTRSSSCLLSTFGVPLAITTDYEGNLYVSDVACGYVMKITPSKVSSIIAGGGKLDVGKGQIANQVKIGLPNGLAYDNFSGNLYITDGLFNAVYMVNRGYLIPYVDDEGVVATNELRNPYGVAIDHRTGALYIASTDNDCIFEVKTGRTNVLPRLK